MKLSDIIAIVAVLVTIIGILVSYNSTSEKNSEVNQSIISNQQISHGDFSPNINGVNGNVNIKK